VCLTAPYRDCGARHLGLRVTSNDVRSWVFIYVATKTNKPREYTIGRCADMSLEAAQIEAGVLSKKLREEEIEPGAAKAARKNATLTVSQLYEQWLIDRDDLRPNTRHSTRSAMKQHIKPLIGDIRICDVTQDHVRKLKAAMVETPIGYNRARSGAAH